MTVAGAINNQRVMSRTLEIAQEPEYAASATRESLEARHHIRLPSRRAVSGAAVHHPSATPARDAICPASRQAARPDFVGGRIPGTGSFSNRVRSRSVGYREYAAAQNQAVEDGVKTV